MFIIKLPVDKQRLYKMDSADTSINASHFLVLNTGELKYIQHLIANNQHNTAWLHTMKSKFDKFFDPAELNVDNLNDYKKDK